MWALRDVSLEIEPGTALGVVGANGAGKSTMLKLLAGILPPDSGTVETGGNVVSLLELGAGFHPDFTGRENVVLNASIHGMARDDVEDRMQRIIDFSELEGFIDAPVRTYSSGMYMRLGFAVASELKPDILLLDEVLAVGDAAFQSKCLARIAEFQRDGCTIVFVSHSQWAVQTVCTRAVWLSGGNIVADGDPQTVCEAYHKGLAAVGEEHGAVEVGEDADWKTARITAVRLSNGEHVTDRFMSGEPFRLEVDYELTEPVPTTTGMTIRTTDGALIAGTDNRVEPAAADPFVGTHRVAFALDAIPLMEGRFSVDVSLEATTGGQKFHERERVADFTMFARGRGFGPVAVSGAWTGSVPA
ncbi:MAG: ABC transporter ATP-binding protein [Thermoleophilia bacterium]|nr:ABC transporter ATP-binding protein [Thermoleophilia bacterium]